MNSPPIITAELLRRYLLATGWMAPNQRGNPHEVWLRGGPGTADVQGIRDALVREAGQAFIERLAQLDGCYPHSVAARLALCAAADIALGEAEAHRTAGPSAATDSAVAIAHALLRRAGVDIESWSPSMSAKGAPSR